VLKPSHCEKCGKRLWGSDPNPHRHQVTELPEIKPLVWEWQQHALTCRDTDCGATTRARLPQGVPTGQFGPRVQGLVGVFGGAYRLSKRASQGMLSDVFGIEMSLGMVSKLERRTAAAIAQPVAEAVDHVQHAPVVNADETGWRENKTKAWLWVAATATVVVYLIHARRTMEAARELLGEFRGLLVTDRYASYNFVDAKRRQACWAHLIRDIEGFRDYGARGDALADKLQKAARALIGYPSRSRRDDDSRGVS
jgi:transposase